mgnify:CR=1 FL=1
MKAKECIQNGWENKKAKDERLKEDTEEGDSRLAKRDTEGNTREQEERTE